MRTYKKMHQTRRKHRRASRKMRGGLDTLTPTSTPPSLHLSDLDVTNESGNTTFETDASNNTEDILMNLPTGETSSTDLSTISENGSELGNMTELDMTFTLDDEQEGGKKKSKRRVRKSKISKKKGSKGKAIRKTKKATKCKKGGKPGFTTSETINPIEYKEDEYDQFKNALNYKP